VGGVQVVRSCTIPGRSGATIHFRVNNRGISELGVVEGAHNRIQIANSLNRLVMHGKILVHCVNPFTEVVNLSAGSMVGKFHSVREGDVEPLLGTTTEATRMPTMSGSGPVPDHAVGLYKGACDGCVSTQ